MDNPFKKRATEFIEEPLTLLSLLSAEPVRIFFDKDSSTYFDRLTLVIGTPGSGKTTLARLLELDTLAELVRLVNNKDAESRQLAGSLTDYGILKDGLPAFLAQRVPCGSNLRSIWELPYADRTKHGLLRTFIQVKTCLGWLRKLERLKVDLQAVNINLKPGAEAYASILKSNDILAFREYARQIEEAVLRTITALVPPKEITLESSAANSSYMLFECIESIYVPSIPNLTDTPFLLRPMVILDDAHELNAKQFEDVQTWLLNREWSISRWVITRVDAIGASAFRKAISALEDEAETPGSTTGRDRIIKLLQGGTRERAPFRRFARDVTRRYFAQMPAFQRRRVEKLDDCLSRNNVGISKSDIKELEKEIKTLIQESRFPKETVENLSSQIPASVLEDERLAVLRILLQRERRKSPQVDLFGDPAVPDNDSEETEEGVENDAAEGATEAGARKTVKADVIVGAELQLTHQFERPFYHSFDRIADASGDNIETFISLAGPLVDELEIQLLRKKKPELDARQQHSILTKRANEIMSQWDFPHCESVKRLIDFIGNRCVEKTKERNAPLSDGANAFGIPQDEMDKLEATAPELVQVIHYAIAYNAINLKENYNCKKRKWCLFLLGGVPIVANRLTLSRGGFCEGHLRDLKESIAP
jgi:energy-coupling factor transporter ATP-binding protein EcfA2